MAEPGPTRLDLDDAPAFQDKFWIFQRIAWVAMGIIVVAALAGLTGQGGPLARATVSGPQGSIDYPRVTRWQTGDELRITLAPGTSDSVAIDIEEPFARGFAIEDIQPAPAESVATGRGQRLIFDLADPTGDKSITIHLRAMHPSPIVRNMITIDGGERLMLSTVVLP